MSGNRNDRRNLIRRMTRAAVLVALALVLSLAERLIPLGLVFPIPGIKLGLANIVTIFALVALGSREALGILFLRVSIMGLISGPIPFILSLSGGLLALLVMRLLIDRRSISLVGVGMGGAVAHNVGQVLMASLIIGTPLLLLTYLPALLLTGLATGVLTGSASVPVCRILLKNKEWKT